MFRLNLSRLLICCSILFAPTFTLAQQFSPETSYETCFTPGEHCTDKIVERILSAKSSVYVQAYSFISAPIAKAILNAKRKGVQVRVILDKSQIRNNRYSSSKFLMNNDVPVYIDYKPARAHNKVIIIDRKILITRSFNLTQAAQNKNAENLSIITDKNLAQKYLKYWYDRYEKSIQLRNL